MKEYKDIKNRKAINLKEYHTAYDLQEASDYKNKFQMRIRIRSRNGQSNSRLLKT